MFAGNERRINGNLNLRRMAAGNLLDDAQELDGAAQLGGKFHVQLGHIANALGVDLMVVHPEAVRKRGENTGLVLRVVAVNVQVRRRFGITLLLGVGQDGGEVRALMFHARQDVIAGAVDNAVNRGKLVGHETFAQGLDNGNAAADAGLIIQVCAAFGRGGK